MEIKPVIGKGKVVNMRKIQVVTDYELYKYEELDSKGKEKAKRKYLDEQDEYEFTDMVEADTTLVFPNSKLKVQYSLSYCQGDGLSVYGKLAFEVFSTSLREMVIRLWWKVLSLLPKRKLKH